MSTTESWESWIGKTRSVTQIIGTDHSRLLATTLDANPVPDGDPLPTCWHWAWFNEALPRNELGRDGHPKLGNFLPTLPLPRRMWAGGDIKFMSPVRVGAEIRKETTIKAIQKKTGRSGPLIIVNLEHQLFEEEVLCLKEMQNLVYREDPKEGQSPTSPPEPPSGADTSENVVPDPVTMFRYSAITFNGHRIHYDADYARGVEGYPGLVFHAPLTATLLAGLANKLAKETSPKTFAYRATSPLFVGEAFRISARKEGDEIEAWATNPSGGLSMRAVCTY